MNFKRLKKSILIIGVLGVALSGSITTYAEASVIINNGSVKINNVPVIGQFPELPTGCEATALTMLLRYYGVNVTKQDVANTIVRVPIQYYKNNQSYGGNPNVGFVGNPYTRSSYGVFEKPIMAAINNYLPHRAENLTGKSFNQLLEVVKTGRPVMIWATIGMSNVSYTQSWRIETGETFRWPNGEHALLLVGYDSTYVYLNDPYSGVQKKYSREVVENRYNSLGKRAVAIIPKVTEIPLTVKVNGEKLDNVYEQKAIYKEDRVLIPVSYLDNLIKGATASYKDNTVYLNIKGEQITLNGNHNKVTTSLRNKNVSELYYEIRDGVTRIDLTWITKNYPITYNLQNDKLTITANEVLKMAVNGEVMPDKDGREILGRGGKIFVPVNDLKALGTVFDYEYIDKKVNIKLGGQSYILEKDENDIEILLEDGTKGKLYYDIEDGITRIEFKGFAKYMNLSYEIQGETVYVTLPAGDEEEKVEGSPEEIIVPEATQIEENKTDHTDEGISSECASDSQEEAEQESEAN